MTSGGSNPGEKAARDARQRLSIDITKPVSDLLDVVEKELDVPVLIERFEDERVAGVLMQRANGDRFIAINADFGAVRQRFTLAHEMGHIEMGHQPRIDAVSDLFGPVKDPQEIQANYFAAEFLAPRLAVTAWLEEQDIASPEDPSVVVRLAFTFGISFAAACFRLERARAISSAAKRRLLGELKEASSELAGRYQGDRSVDLLQTLWERASYPRTPRQTAAFAQSALDQGLLEEDEFNEIVTTVPSFDPSEWMV
jgi:Zn-dependent peptidase ImmA (M78 family)